MRSKGEFGYGIPGTNVAIYHIRSDIVLTHTVDVVYTNSSVRVPSMAHEEMEATIHLFMVSSSTMTEAQKSVFNTISVLLTQSTTFVSLLNDKEIEMIQKYIEENMIGENI
jgi:mannitol/fructose-specific phosphotransferase system IIA component (Ntr-type)